MIDKKKIKSCADNIVKCVSVREGECIYIRGGIYCQELLEEIALNVLRRGGLPHISSTTDYFSEMIFKVFSFSDSDFGRLVRSRIKSKLGSLKTSCFRFLS